MKDRPSFDEIAAEIRAQRELVKITAGRVEIVTPFHQQCNHSYSILLSECDTPEKLLRWIHLLTAKTWCDTSLIQELIARLRYHFQWDN